MKNLKYLLILFIITSCTSLKDPSFREILNNAKHDIAVDSVKHFTGGLPFIKPVLTSSIKDTLSAKNLKSIDSISLIYDNVLKKQKSNESVYNKYGLYNLNLGCVVDKQTNILSKKYKKRTKSYLRKRNGIGWENNLKKELESF